MLIHGKVAEEINGASTQRRTICRCKKKEWGRYLWTGMEWIPRHNGKWKKIKGQYKTVPIGSPPSREKEGDMRTYTGICAKDK